MFQPRLPLLSLEVRTRQHIKLSLCKKIKKNILLLQMFPTAAISEEFEVSCLANIDLGFDNDTAIEVNA